MPAAPTRGAFVPPRPAQSRTSGIGLVQLGGTLSSVGASGSYSIVIGGQSDGSTLGGLPGTSLAYFAATDVNTQWSTGVPYAQALANGWLLKDSSGNLLTNQSTANDYVGDVGNSGYQQAWISNVLAYLADNPGVKGVFIDDVLYDLTPLTGQEAAEYPTQQAWAQAQLSFVEAVGTALRAKGYYVAVNAGGYIPGDSNSDTGANTVAWWQQLGPYVNGLMNEYYQETGDGNNTLRTTGASWTQNWDGWQRLVITAQGMGDDFIGVTYGPAGDTQAMLYGKASFLLDWNGGGGAFIYDVTGAGSGRGTPLDIAWTTSIGQPTAAKQQVGVGWMRAYSGGVDLLNPDPAHSQLFGLNGSYLAASGATVTSIVLAPSSGLVLRSAATRNALRVTG